MDNNIKTKDIRVECSEDSVKINGTEISFPLQMNILVELFGEPSLMQHDLLWNVACQVGGDEIYLNMLPGGSGAEDYFDIRIAEDARHFPRLKKATLCYAEEKVIDELKEMGIEAEWL